MPGSDNIGRQTDRGEEYRLGAETATINPGASEYLPEPACLLQDNGDCQGPVSKPPPIPFYLCTYHLGVIQAEVETSSKAREAERIAQEPRGFAKILGWAKKLGGGAKTVGWLAVFVIAIIVLPGLLVAGAIQAIPGLIVPFLAVAFVAGIVARVGLRRS